MTTEKKYLAIVKMTLPISKGCGYKRQLLSCVYAFFMPKRNDKWINELMREVADRIQTRLKSKYEGLEFDNVKLEIAYTLIDDVFVSPNFNKNNQK